MASSSSSVSSGSGSGKISSSRHLTGALPTPPPRSSSTPSAFASYGITNVGLVLLREGFDVPGARRVHARLINEASGRAIYFTQHRSTIHEAALFLGKDKIGQCSDEDLEFRDVRVAATKLYKTGFFSPRTRSWKAPDGLKYSWQTGDDGSLKLVQLKTNQAMVFAADVGQGRTRIVVSAQILGFVELVLLTMLQQEFENKKELKKKMLEMEDQDADLNVW